MKKIFYTLAVISALSTASLAEESKSEPIKKPDSMSQQEWGGRILSGLEELNANPMYYEILKDKKDLDPAMRETLRIYGESQKKK